MVTMAKGKTAEQPTTEPTEPQPTAPPPDEPQESSEDYARRTLGSDWKP